MHIEHIKEETIIEGVDIKNIIITIKNSVKIVE